jgi:hypothetical protein
MNFKMTEADRILNTVSAREMQPNSFAILVSNHIDSSWKVGQIIYRPVYDQNCWNNLNDSTWTNNPDKFQVRPITVKEIIFEYKK